jgi:glutaminyl-tRNA synthetase
MAVLDPVKVLITNLSSSDAVELDVPNIPGLPDKGTHKVPFDPSELYIDRSDLREVSLKSSWVMHSFA